MNEALKLIQHSIRFLIQCLKDPKTLIYFLPGAIIGLIFWEIYFFLEQIENVIEVIENIPFIGSFLSWIVTAPINFIQFIIIQLLTFFILTILSPMNTFLSERIEFQMNGKKFPFSLWIIIRDIWRMFKVVSVLLFLELTIMITYWLFIGWYNPFDWMNEIIYFVLASFFYGISFFDYSFERHGLGLFKSLNYSKSNFWLVLFSGILFMLLFSIPVVGIITAPVVITIITTFLFVKQPPKFSER